jgi:hypothetical protein
VFCGAVRGKRDLCDVDLLRGEEGGEPGRQLRAIDVRLVIVIGLRARARPSTGPL